MSQHQWELFFITFSRLFHSRLRINCSHFIQCCWWDPALVSLKCRSNVPFKIFTLFLFQVLNVYPSIRVHGAIIPLTDHFPNVSRYTFLSQRAKSKVDHTLPNYTVSFSKLIPYVKRHFWNRNCALWSGYAFPLNLAWGFDCISLSFHPSQFCGGTSKLPVCLIWAA